MIGVDEYGDGWYPLWWSLAYRDMLEPSVEGIEDDEGEAQRGARLIDP